MLLAVISGDIIASTSLGDAGRTLVEESLAKLFIILKSEYDVFARLIKGDYIECVIPKPEDSLKVALLLKCMLKSISTRKELLETANRKVKFFKTYGIRLAIGYGELSRFNPDKGIIDGEAIYLSGRKLNEYASNNKERIVIKNTLYFVSANEKLNNDFDSMFALLDFLINKATARQCEILYYKLMKFQEDQIALKLNISQPVVNQHSTSSGWNAIEGAVAYFSKTIKSLSNDV